MTSLVLMSAGNANPSLALRDFAVGDDAWLIASIASADELERFAGATLQWPLTSAQLQALRDDPSIRALTAYLPPLPHVPVGHAELLRTSETRGRLVRVLVDPARRGEGLGRRLVAAALEAAAEQGLRTLDLNVFADNEPAIRTYLGLGFEPADTAGPDPRQRVLTRSLPR